MIFELTLFLYFLNNCLILKIFAYFYTFLTINKAFQLLKLAPFFGITFVILIFHSSANGTSSHLEFFTYAHSILFISVKFLFTSIM